MKSDTGRKPVSFVLKSDSSTLMGDCVIEVAGQRLECVNDIKIETVDHLETRVTITLLASRGMDVSFPADVRVTIAAYDRMAVIEAGPGVDGTTRYRTVGAPLVGDKAFTAQDLDGLKSILATIVDAGRMERPDLAADVAEKAVEFLASKGV